MARADHRDEHTHQPAASGFRLAELILPFALATDIGTGEPIESALRACLLAVHLGEALGLSEDELADVYHVVLLRFAGCTADGHIAAAAFGDEHAFRAHTQTVDYGNPLELMRAMMQLIGAGQPPLQRLQTLAGAMSVMMREGGEMMAGHCEVAQKLAARLGMRPQIQEALLQSYERWDGKGGPGRLKGEDIARSMRITQLAQNVAVFYRLGGIEMAVEMARRWAGKAFDPLLVERFCQHAAHLCKALEVEPIWDAVLEAEPGPRPRLSADQIEAGARSMADFVDLKSPHTLEHSRRVSALAAAAARRYGLPEGDVEAVRLAGYLHDVGQVGIPSMIWLKPGPLSEGEWERMRLHPYYTERIFARSRSWERSGRCTTNGWMVRATTAASRPRSCRRRRASWPQPMSTRP